MSVLQSHHVAERLKVLARRPAVYYVKAFARTAWVSPTKTAPLATPWPADVLPRARMQVCVIAHVAAAHYCEHLPFNQIEQRLSCDQPVQVERVRTRGQAALDPLGVRAYTHFPEPRSHAVQFVRAT